jgi:hypothetical protein
VNLLGRRSRRWWGLFDQLLLLSGVIKPSGFRTCGPADVLHTSKDLISSSCSSWDVINLINMINLIS